MNPAGVDRVITTEVLVIGGAGAAVAAAVAATEQGAKVTLVSKGKIGRSGNTIMIGGGFGIDGESANKVCGEKEANTSYTKDIMLKKTVEHSFYLSDQNIAGQFVNESPIAVKKLLDWAENAKQIFKFVPVASLWNTSGRSFGNALRQGVKEYSEIEAIEDVMVTDLLVEDKVITGAIGVDVYSGEIILFRAKAVVLGAGGYQPYSLHNSISDMTGDGIAMAFRAGATVSDMEFLLFIPTAIWPQNIKGSIIPYLMTIPIFFPPIFKVTDGDGDEISIPDEFTKVPGGNKLIKLFYSYFWGKRIYEKYDRHGNCFYYSFAHCTNQEIENAFECFSQRMSIWHKQGFYNGVNLEELKQLILKDRKLKVGLGNEYSAGGVEINEKMETRVSGLFAAGEVTSGLFGAFRSGDGLTEMLAQGLRAGNSAAEYATRNGLSDINLFAVESMIQTLLEPLNRTEGVSPLKIHRNIERTADSGFNFFRNGKGLTETVRELERIRTEEIPGMRAGSTSRKYNFEWLTSALVRNLLDCTEVGAKAALMREESRGCHMRTDKPEVDNDHWLVKIVAGQEGQSIRFSKRPPVTVSMPLPKGKIDSIPDYLLGIL